MTILTGSEARGLVESMIDPETQTQMCGMELTLQKIERFTSNGSVAFDNKGAKASRDGGLEFR